MPTVLISAWVITYLDIIHSLLQKISPCANSQLINRTVLALHRSDQLQLASPALPNAPSRDLCRTVLALTFVCCGRCDRIAEL